jgi:hypothetical protein
MATYQSKADFLVSGLQPHAPRDSECAICFENLQAPLVDDKTTQATEAHVAVMIVSCGHTFGSECLHEWLNTANTCPMCRKVLFPGSAEQELELRIEQFFEELSQFFKLARHWNYGPFYHFSFRSRL